jgi:hypothetical protein
MPTLNTQVHPPWPPMWISLTALSTPVADCHTSAHSAVGPRKHNAPVEPTTDPSTFVVFDDLAYKVPLVRIASQGIGQGVNDELAVGAGAQHSPERGGRDSRLGAVGAVLRLCVVAL